jgi:hypothetical protein
MMTLRLGSAAPWNHGCVRASGARDGAGMYIVAPVMAATIMGIAAFV